MRSTDLALSITPLPDPGGWAELCQRPEIPHEELARSVAQILRKVRDEGDRGLVELTERFDKVKLDTLRVPDDAFAGVEDKIAPDLRDAIQLARENIERFHAAQLDTPVEVETQPGVTCWRTTKPIAAVGFYIPAGSAPLFSSILMLAVPARLAGCSQKIICTPPDRDGNIHPAMLYTAKLEGITDIFTIGGAQAAAAMAYGTETVPRVFKIFGPGNQYLNTAKKMLVAECNIGIDLPAGCTELAVVADGSAVPEFVAADLLSQAEHGPDSQVLLISPDSNLLEAVRAELASQAPNLPRWDIVRQSLRHAKLLQARDVDQAIAFSNAYAPEHLILAVADVDAAAERVTTAGSVFLGNYACEAAGDYVSGTNHTLPTNGAAVAYSGVSIDSFVKKITFQRLTADGIRKVGPAIEAMARAEQLEAHARAATVRLKRLN